MRYYRLFKIIVYVCVILSCHSLYANTMSEDRGVICLVKNRPLQEQLNENNVTYVVRSVIDLKDAIITIPENCELHFKRGRILNGEINFRKTKLTGKVCIYSKIKGTVSNETVYVDWFLKKGKSKKNLLNSSDRIQEIFDIGAFRVVFSPGYYCFANIQIGKKRVLEGNGAIIIPIRLNQNLLLDNFNFLKNVFFAKDADSITITGFSFQGYVTKTILPMFSSKTVYGEPLIWIDRADKVVIDKCLFKNIENCTYCNSAYSYYGKKQGSCVCLWDVSDATYSHCEQVNCRHDEQIWVIAVNKPIMDTKVTYRGNYIHDMSPGPNSSAFTCVAGYCLVEDNQVKNYRYPGSMFNTFAKHLIIRNNNVTNSYCSSVFDACEYRYFHNDDILVEDNIIEAVNSVLLLSQSEKVIMRNNKVKGIGLYYSANSRVTKKGAGGYTYWYTDDGDVLPTDVETIIDSNICDFTYYDGKQSIAGTTADYGTGKIIEPQKYNNVGVNYGCGILIYPHEAKAKSIIITNNQFTSIQTFKGLADENNLAGVFPHTIRLVNTDNAVIKGNVFNGCFRVVQSPDNYTCITVYNYPDEMETLKRPKVISQKPSEYGKYIIEDNVFNNHNLGLFYIVSFYPRMNSFRQTPLTIKELVINNNKLPTSRVETKSNRKGRMEYKAFTQSDLLEIKKQTIEY